METTHSPTWVLMMSTVPLLLKVFVPIFSLLKPSTLSMDDLEKGYEKLKEAINNEDYPAVELYSQRIYPSTKKMRFTGRLIKNIFTVNKDGLLDTNRLIEGNRFFHITSSSIKPKILFHNITLLEVYYWISWFVLLLVAAIIILPPSIFIWNLPDIMKETPETIAGLVIAALVLPAAYYAFLAQPLSKNIADLRAYKELYEAWLKSAAPK